MYDNNGRELKGFSPYFVRQYYSPSKPTNMAAFPKYGERRNNNDADGPNYEPSEEEKCGLWGPIDSTVEDIYNGLIGAIKITNTNLINMDARIKARNKPTRMIVDDSVVFAKVNNVVLQTEAVSLFKGNLIRVFKRVWYADHRAINHIKGNLRFILRLAEDYPTIIWVQPIWIESNRERYSSMENRISKAFSMLNTSVTQALADRCIDEYNDANPVGSSITEVSQINLKSIENIKF